MIYNNSEKKGYKCLYEDEGHVCGTGRAYTNIPVQLTLNGDPAMW